MKRNTIAVIVVLAFAALFGFMQPRAERAEAQLNLGLQKPTAVVFCTVEFECVHCEAIKKNYQNNGSLLNLIEGHALSGVIIVTWDGRKWDKPEGQRLYTEFVRATGHKIDSWPVVWLSGSNTYMEGTL